MESILPTISLQNFSINSIIDFILKTFDKEYVALQTNLYRIGYNQTKKQMKDIKKYLYNT